MSDYMVSRKRKRYAVDPCLGYYLLSSGKVISSPSSRSNNFLSKTPAACDTLVPSCVENEHGIEGVCDASNNQHLEDFPDDELQRTPERARQMRPEITGYEISLSSSNHVTSDPRQLMTVEDFLKSSNKSKGVVKKQYGKAKTRIKRLGDNGAAFEPERQYEIMVSDTGDASQNIIQLRSKRIRRTTIYESSSDESSSLNHEASSPLKNKKKKNRGCTLRPLKERLYKAAVLTHGYPDDMLVHGATTGSELASSRRSLRFIPDMQPELDDSQMDKRRQRTWSLVDPRKSMAIRTATFSSKIRSCLQHMDSTSLGKIANLPVRPLKRWKFSDASFAYSSLSNLKSNKKVKTPASKVNEYPPLAFVSLKEAEEDYRSMFSYNHKRSGRLPDVASTLQMVSVAETVSHVEGLTSTLAVPTYDMHILPLEEVIQRPNFTIKVSAVDQARTVDSLEDDISSAPLDSSPIINSIRLPTAAALPVTPKTSQDQPNSDIAPARHGISRANTRERVSKRRGSYVSPKPLRPLASFFNEFIQNIRNVTISQDQTSSSDKHLVSKRSLRKASRNEYNPRRRDLDAIPLRPAATDLTDMSEGIFASQQPWTNNLESIRQNDSKYHMNRQRTLNLPVPHNQRLSPDILAVLEPQDYQVILSSP